MAAPLAEIGADHVRIVAHGLRRALGDLSAEVEHDMKLVMNTADTVAVLDFGRKIAEGPPEAVREDAAVIAAYLGTADA